MSPEQAAELAAAMKALSDGLNEQSADIAKAFERAMAPVAEQVRRQFAEAVKVTLPASFFESVERFAKQMTEVYRPTLVELYAQAASQPPGDVTVRPATLHAKATVHPPAVTASAAEELASSGDERDLILLFVIVLALISSGLAIGTSETVNEMWGSSTSYLMAAAILWQSRKPGTG